METNMKYEKELARLKAESNSQDWFKPLKHFYPTETPRGEKIERRTLKSLNSKVKPTYRDEL